MMSRRAGEPGSRGRKEISCSPILRLSDSQILYSQALRLLKPANAVRNTKPFYWRLVCGAAALVSVLAFTPLVIPPGRYAPMLAGVPLTLWAGIGIACALVALTYVGGRVHPDDEAL